MPITLNGSAGVTTNSGAIYDGIQRGTAVSSTSGTSIDFTGIPSWVKRITVMFNGVSLSGSSQIQIQLGDSGGIETTGYSSGAWIPSVQTTSTTGLLVTSGMINTFSMTGIATISLLSSNLWVLGSSGVNTANGSSYTAGGSKTLSDVLDRIRITTVNGTDTFDAGSINILYE